MHLLENICWVLLWVITRPFALIANIVDDIKDATIAP